MTPHNNYSVMITDLLTGKLKTRRCAQYCESSSRVSWLVRGYQRVKRVHIENAASVLREAA